MPARKPKDQTASSLRFVERAAATDDSRPVLTWARYQSGFTACSDGYRLHVVSEDLTGGAEWLKLKKSCDERDRGRYPNFVEIIPARSSALTRCAVDVAEMTRAVKCALVFAKHSNYSVTLTFTTDAVIVYARSSEFGEIETLVDAVYAFGDEPTSELSQAYNGRYLLDALSRDEERIELSAYDANTPGKLTVGDDRMFAVIMGMSAGGHSAEVVTARRVQPAAEWSGPTYASPTKFGMSAAAVPMRKPARKPAKKIAERFPVAEFETELDSLDTVETVEWNRWHDAIISRKSEEKMVHHSRLTLRRGLAAFADVKPAANVSAQMSAHAVWKTDAPQVTPEPEPVIVTAAPPIAVPAALPTVEALRATMTARRKFRATLVNVFEESMLANGTIKAIVRNGRILIAVNTHVGYAIEHYADGMRLIEIERTPDMTRTDSRAIAEFPADLSSLQAKQLIASFAARVNLPAMAGAAD